MFGRSDWKLPFQDGKTARVQAKLPVRRLEPPRYGLHLRARQILLLLLGAAGAVEAIATLLTINRGVIHPTINYENPDPACDLDYVPNQARRKDVRIAISQGFGFGGHNAVVVLKKYEE